MFCKKLSAKIKAFISKVKTEIEQHAETALSVTSVLKQFLDNPLTASLVSITPTKIDDAARFAIIRALETAIDSLTVVNACKDKTGTEKVKCFLLELKKLHPEMIDAVLIKIAAKIAAKLHGEKEKQSVYDAAVQLGYTLKKL